MRIIWNIDYCGDNSNSEYLLPRGHENPRFYPCERFIPGSLSVRGYDRFNEIVSVDGALMINGEPMTREQAVTMEVPEGHQILGVYCLLDENGDMKNFDVRAAGKIMDGFTFCGFDLSDEWTVSAILNCGDLSKGQYFSRAFSVEELNEYGLISDFKKARKIQRKLIEEYPEEAHAYCVVFAIWRRV